MRFTFERKLKTDARYFGQELTRFAQTYIAMQSESDLLKIDVIEIARSEEEHHWRVTLCRQSYIKPWLTLVDLPIELSVSPIGGDYPLLLKIYPYESNVQQFVTKFVERCEQLWDTIPLGKNQKPPTFFIFKDFIVSIIGQGAHVGHIQVGKHINTSLFDQVFSMARRLFSRGERRSR